MTLGFLFLLILCGQTLYVVPCWLLAARKKIAPSWGHWVVPIWNLFIAYRVGKGPLKAVLIPAAILIFFTLIIELMPMLLLVPGVLVLISISIAVSFFCYLYGMVKWAKNIGDLIEGSQTSFVILLFGLPVLAPILFYTLVSQGLTSLEVASLLSILLVGCPWIAFMVLVIRTPKCIANKSVPINQE